MFIDVKQIVSMSEANQNFSKVVKVADIYEKALILKNNKPKYVLINIENGGYIDLNDYERLDVLSRRLINKHLIIYKELNG